MTDDILSNTGAGKLRSFFERIERLNEDKAAVSADLKEVYAEAKADGFDTKIIRKVIRLRAQDAAARAEEQALIDLYMSATGDLFDDTPVTIEAGGLKIETTTNAVRAAVRGALK